MGQIIPKLAGLPAPECKTYPSPRQYTCKSDVCQGIFAGSREISENNGSLRLYGENCGKFTENQQKFLDFPTPRAAPRNSFALFARLGAILVDN